jgi:hypothetical protein
MHISILELVAIVLLSAAASVMTLFVWAFRAGESPVIDGLQAITAKFAGYTAGYIFAFYSFTLGNTHLRWWFWAAAALAFVGGTALSAYFKRKPAVAEPAGKETDAFKGTSADLD